MALYSDSSGPDDLLASAISGSYEVAGGRNEYNITDPPLSSPVVLTAGTYWIAGIFEATTSLADFSATSSVRYKTLSPWNSPFPDPLTGETSDNLGAVNFYLIGRP